VGEGLKEEVAEIFDDVDVNQEGLELPLFVGDDCLEVFGEGIHDTWFDEVRLFLGPVVDNIDVGVDVVLNKEVNGVGCT
jgi:hypothetical protein